MARGEIKIPIAVDTSGISKEIDNGLVEPLEDAEDALKKLSKVDAGKDLERDLEKASKATDDLEDELDDARKGLQKLGYAAKDAGDDAKKGMDRASEGVDEFKDEARQSAREGAASFSGEFEDVADFIQETLANALSGFGPIGTAAGIALAAVVGTALNNAVLTQEKITEARERASELASTLYENHGEIPMAEQLDSMFDRLAEESGSGNGLLSLIDNWVDFGSTLDGVKKAAKQTGSEVGDLLKAMSGDDLEQSEKMLDAVNKKIKELEGNVGTSWAWDENLRGLRETRDEIEKNVKAQQLATDVYEEMGGAAAKAAEEQAERVKAANESVTESALDAYDSMRDAAYEKATADDAAFSVDKWLSYVEETRVQADNYKANLAGMKMTPAEWDNFLALPEDARASIADSYAKAGEEGKTRIRSALGDGGADAGADATVGFDENFNPDAEVVVEADTAKAESDLKAVTSKKRTADIKANVTGEAKAKRDLDALAKDRHATIRVRANTSQATATVNNWRRNQEARPVYITVKARTGGKQLT